MLNAKIPHLSRWNERRRQIAGKYIEALKQYAERGQIVLPSEASSPSENVWALFTIRVIAGRDKLIDALAAQKIGTGVYYYKILPDHSPLLRFAHGEYPNARKFSEQVLSLPMYPELSDQEVERVITAVQNTLTQQK